MASETNQAPQVSTAEVLGVVQKLYGADCQLIHYEAEKGTKSVQGFLSSIIRVTTKVKTAGGQVHETKFIIKRMPELVTQQQFANDLGAFEHEIAFFERCAPILLQQRSDLPVVTCIMSNLAEKIIYMEDLKEQGFVALVRNVAELKNDVLKFEHFKLIAEAMAKFHSASAGINWLEKFPDLFETDSMVEGAGGAMFKKMITDAMENTIIPIAQLHFKGNEKLLKSVKWMASDDYFKLVQDLVKADPKVKNNVLCHGDSWANNMMFKIDSVTGKPVDMKLIDFQICRYAPATRDLQYCLYLCANNEYRRKYEMEILRHYLHAYNKALSEVGKFDYQLTWDEFIGEYESSLAFSLMMVVAFRPMIYIGGTFPEGDEAMTEEIMQKLLDGGAGVNAALEKYNTNDEFKNEIVDTIQYVHAMYQKLFP